MMLEVRIIVIWCDPGMLEMLVAALLRRVAEQSRLRHKLRLLVELETIVRSCHHEVGIQCHLVVIG